MSAEQCMQHKAINVKDLEGLQRKNLEKKKEKENILQASTEDLISMDHANT